MQALFQTSHKYRAEEMFSGTSAKRSHQTSPQAFKIVSYASGSMMYSYLQMSLCCLDFINQITG